MIRFHFFLVNTSWCYLGPSLVETQAELNPSDTGNPGTARYYSKIVELDAGQASDDLVLNVGYFSPRKTLLEFLLNLILVMAVILMTTDTTSCSRMVNHHKCFPPLPQRVDSKFSNCHPNRWQPSQRDFRW